MSLDSSFGRWMGPWKITTELSWNHHPQVKSKPLENEFVGVIIHQRTAFTATQGTVAPELPSSRHPYSPFLSPMLGKQIQTQLRWYRLPTPPPPGEALPLLLPCRKEEERISPSVSLLLTKGHNHCLLWVFFCEHFTALLGAGLRLPVVFLWPLNNYQLVEAGSWIPETKFILLVGGKGLCLSLQPSVQQTRQLLPQIAQTVFGSLSCMPKATPPGFTWWRRLHELLLKNREKYFQR